jgi:hypothetical protein
MAAAIVTFVYNWIEPPPADASALYEGGFYLAGILLLGIGWWLRRSSPH